jgi:Flp pilus assembly protein CpaB
LALMALRAVDRRAEESASDVPVVSTSPPTKRRPSWVLAGAAMVVLAALLGAYVFQAVTDEMTVVVAAGDLAPGEPIDAADLRVVRMGQAGDLRAIQSDQQDLIIGRVPRAPIPAGTVLNTSLFVAEADALPAGRVVVGGTFEPGAVPTASLRAGDEVALIVVTPTGPAAPAGGEGDAAATVIGEATIWAVADPGSIGDTGGVPTDVFVSLLVDEDLQTTVAQAAASGLLRLSLIGP